MGKFKITDKYVAMVNAIAGGMEQWQAYKEHVATIKNPKKSSCSVQSTKLMRRPEMKDLLQKARIARGEAITQVIARSVAEEFSTTHLTVDELDSYHYAIIQGKVLIEEVVPTWTSTEVLNKEGKVVQRQRTQNFVRVSRPPNVREKQISIDAIYKRKGDYAPSRFFGGIKNMNDDPAEDNVERVILLSNGETVPLLP